MLSFLDLSLVFDPFPHIHLQKPVPYFLRSGGVRSEEAGWNTLDFHDITIVLIFLFKARLEKLKGQLRPTCQYEQGDLAEQEV